MEAIHKHLFFLKSNHIYNVEKAYEIGVQS